MGTTHERGHGMRSHRRLRGLPRGRQKHLQRLLLAGVAAATLTIGIGQGSGAPPVHAEVRAETGAAQPPGAEPVAVPYNEEHPVLAYYYAWLEPEVLDRGVHTPILRPRPGSPQIVDDESLLREHIRLAQGAGIDGFVVNRTSDMARLLDLAQAYDFRVTVQVDAGGDAEAQLAEFYGHAGHPAMVRYQGRPVVFFWRAAALPDARWRDIRSRLDPDHAAVWLADGDNFGILRSDVWDGISPYQIAWSPTPETQLPGWGAKARAAAPGKLYVPPVAPGCNDSPARPTTCLQNRRDGAYYQRTLQGALNAGPAWATIVSTFNEWLEDTQIEPSPEYGDLYLQLTRQFAEAFKGEVPAPPCC